MKQIVVLALGMGLLATGCATFDPSPISSPPPEPGGKIEIETFSSTEADPYEAGQEAAFKLWKWFGGTPHMVILGESFEEPEQKKQVLKGVLSYFEKDRVVGFTTYGGFTERGSLDVGSVNLMGINGAGIGVHAVLEQEMGAAGLSIEKDEQALSEALSTLR